MAQIQFESKLTPEQIRARLTVLAKPAESFGWRMGEGAFYFRFYTRTSFFLIRTRPGRSGGAAINQPVFLGKLSEKDGTTRIAGRFGGERRKAILTALVILLLLSLINAGVYMEIAAGILVLTGAFFVSALASSLYAEEERAVIDLIEKHLLS